MIVDGLQRANSKQEPCLADIHETCFLRDDGTERVQEEAFDGVVVDGAERVRDVEAVVDGVDVFVQVFVHVHETVEEILPSVYDEPAIALW